jgi:hypothetical protein
MGDEPCQDQLIGDLGELRALVIQIGAGERGVRDDTRLNGQYITVKTTLLRLSTSRTPSPPSLDNVPEMKSYLAEKKRIEEQDRALGEAIEAIWPDFPAEAIDNAIRVAESQCDC